MRFRPANIRLINRRSNLPRLRLALSSKNKNKNKNHPIDVQGLTGHSISGRELLGFIWAIGIKAEADSKLRMAA
jgi:hypothetical protein